MKPAITLSERPPVPNIRADDSERRIQCWSQPLCVRTTAIDSIGWRSTIPSIFPFPFPVTRLLLTLVLVSWAASAAAQTPFQIGPINIDKMRFAENGKNIALPYAVTRVSVPEDVASRELYVVAYYFSEDGKRVAGGTQGQFTETKEKDRVSSGPSGGLVSMPATLKARKWYEVKFGAPREKWNRVIVVVGKKGDMVGRIHPKTGDWSQLDFPDKASVRMSQ